MSIKRKEQETINNAASGYDRVVGFLRDGLLAGNLKAGDCLLPEREMAVMLGVSRPVVREALRALAMIGAVEIRHGVGSIITRPNASVLSEFFTFLLAHQSDALDDIIQARIAIERQAIRLACHRASQSDFDILGAHLRDIAATIDRPDEGSKADFRFHEAIVLASASPTLIGLYRSIALLLQRSHFERRQHIIKVPGIEKFLIDHHRLIFAALAERNESKASELLDQHFAIGADFRLQATLQMAENIVSP